MLDITLQETLSDRDRNFLVRTRTPVEHANGAQVIIDGKPYLSFSSNNYLGLAQHPKVIAASQVALAKYGLGSGSAYLVAGYTSAHQALEEYLAHFLRYPKVLLFSSGYLANLGVIKGLFAKNDTIFSDKLNHASLLDGCLSSGALLKRYPHCQTQKLEKFCQEARSSTKAIVTEGLFGMDGSIAPLNEIAMLARKYEATLLVDDAHAIGVLGENGRGSIEHFDLDFNNVPILTGTLGKAFGCYGAFAASSDLVIESLVQLSRTYIYTTAIPPAVATGALASLIVSQEEAWRREKLITLVAYFRQCAQQLGIPCLDSITPIQPILLGSSQKALEVSQLLLDKGIFVKAIRPPTVPPLTARLRVTLTAEHTEKQIDFLLEALHAII